MVMLHNDHESLARPGYATRTRADKPTVRIPHYTTAQLAADWTACQTIQAQINDAVSLIGGGK